MTLWVINPNSQNSCNNNKYVYANDLPCVVNQSSVVMYADNSTMFFYDSNINDDQSINDVKSTGEWDWFSSEMG